MKVPGALPFALVSLMVIVCGPVHNLTASSQSQTVDIETVRLHQPRIDPAVETSDSFIEIRYCATSAAEVTYITYVYVWSDSVSPDLSNRLGYRSHSWDFEPITARIDNGKGTVDYAFDSGHYEAGTTSDNLFRVDSRSHRFRSLERSTDGPPSTEQLVPITPESLESMNRLLATLPRLPFGPPLSLDWACSDPESIFTEGYFSSDDRKVSPLPPQVTFLLSTALGLLIAPAHYLLSRLTCLLAPVRSAAGIKASLSGAVVGVALATVASFAADTVTLGIVISLAALTIFYLLRFIRVAKSDEHASRPGCRNVHERVSQPHALAVAAAICVGVFAIF